MSDSRQAIADSQPAWRAACAAWIITWLVIAGIILGGNKRTVWPAYRNAGAHWESGEPLYQLGPGEVAGHGFLYFPQAAILFVPFAHIPEPASGILWRGLSLAMLALGVWRISTLFQANARKAFLLATAVTIPTCLAGLRTGQATLAMTGMILIAIEAFARSKNNRAAVWLALSIALKPLGVVPALLASVVSPRLGWRWGVAMAVVAISPFFFQQTSYVLLQHQQFLEMIRAAEKLGSAEWFAHLFGMLRAFGVMTPPSYQFLARLAAAPMTLLLCVAISRRVSRERAAIWIYTLGAVYLMLFNPRTENSTYLMLGPAIGYFLADEWLVRRRNGRAAFLVAMTVAITGCYEIAAPFTPAGAVAIWLAPLACVVFSGYLATRYREDWSQAAPSLEAAAAQSHVTHAPHKGRMSRGTARPERAINNEAKRSD